MSFDIPLSSRKTVPMYISTTRASTGESGSMTRGSVEYTRSWRTGRSLGKRGSHALTDPPIRMTGESLGSYIKRRNNYNESLRDHVVSSPTYKGFSLTGDSGHSFHNTKAHCWIGTGTVYSTRASGVQPRHQSVCIATPVFRIDYPSTSSDYGPPNDRLPSINRFVKGTFSIPFETNHLAKVEQATQNILHSSVPGIKSLGFGETVVELLRGNLPGALRDIRARIKQGRLLDPKGYGKDLGSEYLNYRFGIEPICNDIVSLILHYMSLHESIYDTTKRFRVTGLISDAADLKFIPMNWNSSDPGNNMAGGMGRVTASTDVRLSAKYAKIRPSGHARSFYEEAHDKLYYLGFNKKLAWDLIPWSWLVDWSGNIGRSISMAQALDPGTGNYKVVYAYATRKTLLLATLPAGSNTYSAGHGGKWPSLTSSSTVLHRTAVSPFGPKFAFNQLTSYQLSILAALGFVLGK